MYTFYADDTMFYDDSSSAKGLRVLSPKLSLKKSTAGTLDITLPISNVAYGRIKKMVSTIYVRRNNVEIWRGRVLTEDLDFYKNRVLKCEGALSFLNDTIEEPMKYDGTASEFFESVLDNHNDKCDKSSRKIFLGRIENPRAALALEGEFTSSYDIIKNALDILGGDINIRIYDGKAYMDYIEDDYVECSQSITFGKNMLDMTKTFDMSDITTVLVPRGKADDTLDEGYVTVKPVNGGSIYVMHQLIMRYGRFEKVMDWPDVDDPEILLARAEEYLTRVQFETMVIELTALDLSYLDITIDSFNLLEKVICRSWAHGDEEHEEFEVGLPVTAIDIDFANPQNTKITLGKVTARKDNLSTALSDKISRQIVEETPAIVDKQVAFKMPDIIEVTNEHTISADVMMSTFCFSRYILTQFLETNFDAIDYRNKSPKNIRHYIQIYDNKIKFIEAHIDTNEWEYYKDPSGGVDEKGFHKSGKQLYWTSIDDSSPNRYKFFTYESPLTIAKDKRPGGDITDEEFENMYKVKVWKMIPEETYVKGEIGFPMSDGTGEPEIKLGTGDASGNGVGNVVKDADSFQYIYSSRADGLWRGYKIMDDGVYYCMDGKHWVKFGSIESGNVAIIDHEPTEADLTGQYTLFARFDKDSMPVVNAEAGKIFETVQTYVEMPAHVIIKILPDPAAVTKGKTLQLSIESGVSVTWSVSGGASGTAISGDGLLTCASDETAETLTVRATSTEFVTDYGEREIEVKEIPFDPSTVIYDWIYPYWKAYHYPDTEPTTTVLSTLKNSINGYVTLLKNNSKLYLTLGISGITGAVSVCRSTDQYLENPGNTYYLPGNIGTDAFRSNGQRGGAANATFSEIYSTYLWEYTE